MRVLVNREKVTQKKIFSLLNGSSLGMVFEKRAVFSLDILSTVA